MRENDNVTSNMLEEDGFSLKKILSYAVAYWKTVLVSVILCFAVAFAYLRVAVPNYQVTAKILLQDKERGSFASQADMLADFGFQAQDANVENEIEVIKSMSVTRGAVADALDGILLPVQQHGRAVHAAGKPPCHQPVFAQIAFKQSRIGTRQVPHRPNLHIPQLLRGRPPHENQVAHGQSP